MNNTRFAAFVLSALTSACAYQMPTAPTPTTPPSAAPPVRQLARLEVLPQPGAYDAHAVTLLVKGVDETGIEVDVDATCSASSGFITPDRLVGRGAAIATWRDMLPLAGSVTCRMNDREASAKVDMSAWTVQLVDFYEQISNAWRWETIVRLSYQGRGGYPAEVRAIAWGDGAVDQVGGHVPVTSTTREVRHTYPGPGDYEIRAWVGWQHGGVAEVRGVLSRRCRGAYGPNPINQPPDLFGICESSFREIR